VLVARVHYGPVLCARGTRVQPPPADHETPCEQTEGAEFILKIIPQVDRVSSAYLRDCALHLEDSSDKRMDRARGARHVPHAAGRSGACLGRRLSS